MKWVEQGRMTSDGRPGHSTCIDEALSDAFIPQKTGEYILFAWVQGWKREVKG